MKQLRGHDKGRTLKTIKAILEGKHDQQLTRDIPLSEEARHALSEKLNYWVDIKVLRAADFGIPQNRERVYIVGFDKNQFSTFSDEDFNSLFQWPKPRNTPTKMGDILQSQEELDKDFLKHNKARFTISDKLWDGHQKRKKNIKRKVMALATLYSIPILNIQIQLALVTIKMAPKF